MSEKIELTSEQIQRIVNYEHQQYRIEDGPKFVQELFVGHNENGEPMYEDSFKGVFVDTASDDHALYRVQYYAIRTETDEGPVWEYEHDAVFEGVRVFPHQITKTIYLADGEQPWQGEP